MKQNNIEFFYLESYKELIEYCYSGNDNRLSNVVLNIQAMTLTFESKSSKATYELSALKEIKRKRYHLNGNFFTYYQFIFPGFEYFVPLNKIFSVKQLLTYEGIQGYLKTLLANGLGIQNEDKQWQRVILGYAQENGKYDVRSFVRDKIIFRIMFSIVVVVILASACAILFAGTSSFGSGFTVR